MTSEPAALRLEAAVVSRVFDDGDVERRPESRFLDLVVDGRPLRAMVGEPAGDLVSELNRLWLPGVREAVDRLLGRRPSEDLAAGRVALLVCARCGDLGCGQLTAVLEIGSAEGVLVGLPMGERPGRPHAGAAPALGDRVRPCSVRDCLRRYPRAGGRAPVRRAAPRRTAVLRPWQWGCAPPGVTGGAPDDDQQAHQDGCCRSRRRRGPDRAGPRGRGPVRRPSGGHAAVAQQGGVHHKTATAGPGRSQSATAPGCWPRLPSPSRAEPHAAGGRQQLRRWHRWRARTRVGF